MAKNTDLIAITEGLYAKAPSLPANAREGLAKVAPWIALIFGILGVLGSIGGLGLLAVFSPLAVFGGAAGVASYGSGFIAALIWLVASVMLLAAYPGTAAKKISGWNLLFWSQVVQLIGSVVALSIVSGIVGAAIGFYLLFQIKSYFK